MSMTELYRDKWCQAFWEENNRTKQIKVVGHLILIAIPSITYELPIVILKKWCNYSLFNYKNDF